MKEYKYDDEQFFNQYSQMSRLVDGLKGAGEWHVWLWRILSYIVITYSHNM